LHFCSDADAVVGMLIRRCRAEQFRCFEAFEVELSPAYNVISGQNASGKTSFLEALVFLGRGKSFRNARVGQLVRHGEKSFTVFAELLSDGGRATIGVRGGVAGVEVRVNPGGAVGLAEAARLLPIAVVDPDVHELIAGGPERRRRFLDTFAFHVEHGFVEDWRRFRRVLRQRNAALRSGSGPISIWDEEFIETSMRLDQSRRRSVEALRPVLAATCETLLSDAVDFEYAPGWPEGTELRDCLFENRKREARLGSTQYGPHRGELRVRFDERQAKRFVSRGQQKLLASSFLLASTSVIQERLHVPVVVLLDDPAAELDRHSLERLMREVGNLNTQVIITSLHPDAPGMPEAEARFHVEHGRLSVVGSSS